MLTSRQDSRRAQAANEEEEEESSSSFDNRDGDAESSEGDDDDSGSTDDFKEDEKDRVGPLLSEHGQNLSQRAFTRDYADDLESGRAVRQSGQFARVRSVDGMTPQSGIRRRFGYLLRPFRWQGARNLPSEKEEDRRRHSQRAPGSEDESHVVSRHGRLLVQEKETIPAGSENRRQYHLEAIRQSRRLFHRLGDWMGLGSGSFSLDGAWGPCCGINVNSIVLRYLRWAFRSSFAAVLLTAALGFLGITMAFALVIWWIGRRRPQCIGGVDRDTDYFMDAFALSWTTFSTVGYGLVYSAVSSDHASIQECTGITILVTWEAFLGILFSSFCGAILFGKINRIQSVAQVSFSDAIVVRYGSGVQVEQRNNESILQSSLRKFPCPILEFRIVNGMDGIVGGEILDASVTVVASIDVSQAKHLTRHRRQHKKIKNRGHHRRVSHQAFLSQRSGPVRDTSNESLLQNDGNQPQLDPDALSPISPVVRRRSSQNSNANVPIRLRSSGSIHESFCEDPTGHLAHTKIFTKVEVDSPDHPFFKRVWNIRIKLDQHSPLLLEHVRDRVTQNGGYWPDDLNSASGVRSSVRFDRILVSLSGTSNASANVVYAQKIYEYADLHCGYRFVNMLYRDRDDNLRADVELLNDVMEQAGGGGEIFASVSHRSGGSMDNMLVL